MNEGGGEVLSHIISLDTCHPASLKQSLSLCQSCGPVEDAVHAYTQCTLYTRIYKTKAAQRQITLPPGALIDRLLQRTGITGMKTSEGERREGGRKGKQEKG